MRDEMYQAQHMAVRAPHFAGIGASIAPLSSAG